MTSIMADRKETGCSMIVSREELQKEIVHLLSECNENIEISKYDTSLFSSEIGFSARDLVFVCRSLKDKFRFDFNAAIEKMGEYSIKDIAGALEYAICQSGK